MYQGRDHIFILRLKEDVCGKIRENHLRILGSTTVKEYKNICSLRKCCSIQNCPINSSQKRRIYFSSKAKWINRTSPDEIVSNWIYKVSKDSVQRSSSALIRLIILVFSTRGLWNGKGFHQSCSDSLQFPSPLGNSAAGQVLNTTGALEQQTCTTFAAPENVSPARLVLTQRAEWPRGKRAAGTLLAISQHLWLVPHCQVHPSQLESH